MKKMFLLAMFLGSLVFVVFMTTNAFSYTISNDRGGTIISYQLKYLKLKDRNEKVKVIGRCESACTLVLQLKNVCITRSARFGFHLPYDGTSGNTDRKAADFLTSRYPNWVRNWISLNGGLSKNMKYMEYSTARKYMKTC